MMSNQVQVNGGVAGFITGICDGNELGFGVYTSGGPSPDYAAYSLDAGNTWIPLAINQITLVEATGNPVQWRVSQAVGAVKFVIEPGSPDPE